MLSVTPGPLAKIWWHLSWWMYERREYKQCSWNWYFSHEKCSLWHTQVRDIIRIVWHMVSIPAGRGGHQFHNMQPWKADLLQRAPLRILFWSRLRNWGNFKYSYVPLHNAHRDETLQTEWGLRFAWECFAHSYWNKWTNKWSTELIMSTKITQSKTPTGSHKGMVHWLCRV